MRGYNNLLVNRHHEFDEGIPYIRLFSVDIPSGLICEFEDHQALEVGAQKHVSCIHGVFIYCSFARAASGARVLWLLRATLIPMPQGLGAVKSHWAPDRWLILALATTQRNYSCSMMFLCTQ